MEEGTGDIGTDYEGLQRACEPFHFRRYPEANNPQAVESLERSVYEYLGEDNIKPARYNNRLVYLSTSFNWCTDNGMIEDNPLLNFKKRKAEGRIVNLDENVLMMPDVSTYTGLRNHTLMIFFLDTGIRPKEAFALRKSDFNVQALEVEVRQETAKTKASRTLHYSPETAKVISDLLSVRPEEWDESVPVFCTYEGNPLNRLSWGDRIESYCKKLGTHIVPYDLRHSFALLFLRQGGNALALQRMLGHVDLTMTKRYVALTNNDLKNQHALASPIKRLLPSKKRMGKLK
ncbi:tyrosine-type recombinase/integrase [Paenibacillus wynnii]|uniref:tyrosine-type recombinase/integrase n=1 Tax=Paenibacillus wynnii TaxID=268407 RepID=UPI0027924816|nr:site-specific integrase [Paenibacillus wynnii]MDQ0192529.1 site-specific recombinase XerD [Paenibacillus wynnii]